MDLKIKIGKITFKNPVWVASGTFGYGKEFEDFLDLGSVGAVITKTLTLNAREGNPPPRIVETPSGLLNSIGLENQGIDHFIREYWPFLKKIGTKVIISITGTGREEFVRCAERIAGEIRPDAVEINLSCPNVTHRGTRFRLMAQDPVTTGKVITAVRKRIGCPVIAKLTPDVTDITVVARAAESAGADAVSLVNTYPAMAVDAEEMRPVLGNMTGGLSGPAIKPMALKAVWDVYNSVKVPVIGIGGVMTGKDCAEFVLCGARAVQVGTANLADPVAYARILDEFTAYLKKKKIKKIKDLVGRLGT
ncbi:MAG: dihydroorotate dehydrogenase [Candidatus Omnitrophota bacterium]|nr:dihydroorotate dehydrogenase [Candidatus Omnitrophota bacterium]